MLDGLRVYIKEIGIMLVSEGRKKLIVVVVVRSCIIWG